MLRRQDDSIVAILTEMHQQWVVDLQHGHAAFYVRTSSKTPRAVQKTSATLWHKRLGHPGPSAIEHLVHQSQGVRIKGVTTVECNVCGRAKSRR